MGKVKNERDKNKSSSFGKGFANLLEEHFASFKIYKRGERVKGRIIKKEKDFLLLDIKGKSEGLVYKEAFKEAKGLIENLEVGDEVEATVLVPESPEGYTLLSLRQAVSKALWDKIKKAKIKETPLDVEAKSVTPSGVIVDVLGLIGFIPRSCLSKKLMNEKEGIVGKVFQAVVLEADESSNRLVLSERAVTEKEELELVKKATLSLKEGEVYEGEVVGIYNFGCFVRIMIDVAKRRVPVEGLVHISELSWKKVESVADEVKIGQKVKVKVLSTAENKVSLSIKQAQKDPWEDIDKNYKVDMEIEGQVKKVSDFGVFLEIEPGIEGLIHITKIPPGQTYKRGETVKAYIEDIDKEQRRISLRPVLKSKPIGYR